MGTGVNNDREQIEGIINGSKVCRLAVIADEKPYLVPMSFGYDGENIYLHTGMTGRKIRGFESSPGVCFEFEGEVRLLRDDENGCGWSFSFESVIGYGDISELSGEEKIAGMNRIMVHYSGREWSFDPAVLENTRVWKIAISEISGRVNGE